MTRILFVVSAADHWTLQDGTRHPTGFWAEELVEPYTVFDEAGYDITVATPGGRTPVVDQAVDERFGELVRHFVEADKVVAMVCHAPAALLPAHGSGGRWLFEGYRLTSFTNIEEVQAGLADKAPWLLQDRLQEAGAVFSSAGAWEPYVVVDRVLYTGQNPASSRPLAERVVAEIPARARS